jgi:putative transposase
MARLLRFAPARIPLHVRCRGNQQQDVFLDDQDRRRYMELLVRHAAESAVSILGLCQMTNHVHLILEPATDNGLTRLMARLNSEFAQIVQFRANRTGHLFQGRFKSTAMGDGYRWNALRYVELNPVRAGITARPQDWPWSSAAAHLGLVERPEWLDCRAWSERWNAANWAEFLGERVSAEEQGQIRRATREMRPLADAGTVRQWEVEYGVRLTPGKPGRPKGKGPGREEHQLPLFGSAAVG